MGRYFGREPRYSREELERQAQEAIDARISLGRPPAEEFVPVEQRLAEMDAAAVVAPPVAPVPEPQPRPESQPLRIHQVQPPAAVPAAAKAARSARQPAAAAARSSAN
jgi:hypothetical protein